MIVVTDLEAYWIPVKSESKYFSCVSEIYSSQILQTAFLILSNRDFISMDEWPEYDLE